MKKSLAFIGIVASLVVVSTMLETLATPVSAVSQAGNHENSTGSSNSTNLGTTNNNNGSNNNPATSGSTITPTSPSGY